MGKKMLVGEINRTNLVKINMLKLQKKNSFLFEFF